MDFNRPQLREEYPNAFYQAAHLRKRTSGEVYKYVVCPRQSALRFIHLTAKSSRLVSEALDKLTIMLAVQ